MTPSYEPEPRTTAAEAALASLVHAPIAAITLALVAQPLVRPGWWAETVALTLPHALLLGAAGGLLEAWVRRRPSRRRWTALAPLPLVAACGVQEAMVGAASYPPLVVKLIPVAFAALAVTAALLVRTASVTAADAPAASDEELEAAARVPVREGHPWLRLVGVTMALLVAGLVAIAMLPRGA